MARGVNRVYLIGNVGKDAELKYTGAGVAVATLTLATSESWKDGESVKESTTWHNIVAWRKTAELMGEYVKKGARLFVEGKIQNRSYDKDGEKRYVSEIVVDNFMLLDKRDEAQGEQKIASQSAPALSQEGLPF